MKTELDASHTPFVPPPLPKWPLLLLLAWLLFGAGGASMACGRGGPPPSGRAAPAARLLEGRGVLGLSGVVAAREPGGAGRTPPVGVTDRGVVGGDGVMPCAAATARAELWSCETRKRRGDLPFDWWPEPGRGDEPSLEGPRGPPLGGVGARLSSEYPAALCVP